MPYLFYLSDLSDSAEKDTISYRNNIKVIIYNFYIVWSSYNHMTCIKLI